LAHLEGGIELLIADCVSTLSPIQRHLDGRAAGFFVGVYRCELGTDGEHVDLPDRFAYACSETAPPTAEAIGDLVQEALEMPGTRPTSSRGAAMTAVVGLFTDNGERAPLKPGGSLRRPGN
jgi:hypothetical protein